MNVINVAKGDISRARNGVVRCSAREDNSINFIDVCIGRSGDTAIEDIITSAGIEGVVARTALGYIRTLSGIEAVIAGIAPDAVVAAAGGNGIITVITINRVIALTGID